MQNLIINADDFGLSKKFNKGIFELIKKGIITSTTVMIKRKNTEPQKLLIFKNISIGLHLELPEKTTAQEINRQIEGFILTFGKKPSHLDGHQHCHLSEFNLPLTLEIAKKHSLPIRSRFEDDRKIIKENVLKTPGNFISWHPNRISALLEKLDNNNSETAELVCHPGYYDSNCDYPYNKERKKELFFLKSKQFKEAISKFKLINYQEL